MAIFLGNCLISWSAKKQSIVSRSSTEAKYRSLPITTREVFWLRTFFKELKVFLLSAPIIWCDNLNALALASNLVFHARMKHIEVDYHFIWEKVLNRDVLLKFISTGDQIANIFTKGLSSARFLFLKSKLMVLSSPISLQENVIIKIANAAFKAKASKQGFSKVRSSARMIAGSSAIAESSNNKKDRLRSITVSSTGSITPHPNDTQYCPLLAPLSQTSQKVTHPGTTLTEARLTAEF